MHRAAGDDGQKPQSSLASFESHKGKKSWFIASTAFALVLVANTRNAFSPQIMRVHIMHEGNLVRDAFDAFCDNVLDERELERRSKAEEFQRRSQQEAMESQRRPKMRVCDVDDFLALQSRPHAPHEPPPANAASSNLKRNEVCNERTWPSLRRAGPNFNSGSASRSCSWSSGGIVGQTAFMSRQGPGMYESWDDVQVLLIGVAHEHHSSHCFLIF